MTIRNRVPLRLSAAASRVPLTLVGTLAVSVGMFFALVITGMTWFVALLALVGALVIGSIVLAVPRTPLVLGNDIDSLSEEDQDALFLAAYQARLDAGAKPIEDKEEV